MHQNAIQQVFLSRDRYIVDDIICYFWIMTILSTQNLKNTKYCFGAQKGVKNSIKGNFLIHNPQIVGGFICYFWFMTIL